MATKIYVELPKKWGDYKVDLGGASWAQITTAGAGLGASVGSIIPGIGNAVGGAVGAVTGTIAHLFGFQSGRDEVRDVMRKILANAFGSIMPDKMRLIGSARDVPQISGQYHERDIRALLGELHRRTIAELSPGGDTWTDLNNAFNNLVFNRSDTSSGYLMLVFDRIDEPTKRYDDHVPDLTNGNSEPGKRDSGGSDAASGVSASPGKIFGLSPVVLAAAGIGIAVALRSR